MSSNNFVDVADGADVVGRVTDASSSSCNCFVLGGMHGLINGICDNKVSGKTSSS